MARVQVKAGLGLGPDGIERDLDVADGELFALAGSPERWARPLLRRIAGLDASKNDVRLADVSVVDLPPESRGVAMVFATGALFSHLSVHDNLAFGLRARRASGPELKERVLEAAQAMGLERLLKRALPALTAAERVRVAIARGLTRRPGALLLDDPFAGLGATARHELRGDLARVQRRLKLTMLLATSDLGEALALGHRLALFDGTVVRQVGTPADLYERPLNRHVAARAGSPPMSLVTLPVENGRVGFGGLSLAVPPAEKIVLGIRPEELLLDETATASLPLRASVELAESQGARSLVDLSVSGHRVRMVCDTRRVPVEGTDITVFTDLQRVRVFAADEQGVLIAWTFPAALPIASPLEPTPVSGPPASAEASPPEATIVERPVLAEKTFPLPVAPELTVPTAPTPAEPAETTLPTSAGATAA
jgi:multiple sugar transport system ATP-binding protein